MTPPPGVNTLAQFYVIYVKDFNRWDELDYTDDHKEELVALEARLSLCLNTYYSDMTFGIMNTTLLSQKTDLNWLSGKEVYDVNSSIDTVTATHKGEKFWMSGLNKESLYNYLSVQTFTGTASMRTETRDGGGNSSENDVVRRIQASLYKDRAGIDGLSRLLNNLAVSMSNAYVINLYPFLAYTDFKVRLRTSTDLPDNVPGISSSFEVYIQIEWTWMIVPIATHPILNLPGHYYPSKSATQNTGLEIFAVGGVVEFKFRDTK